jgi:hypothetical protein
MKCKFNKDKAKSALKKAGLAVRGLERFIMASDKYFKSLSKKEADSVQTDMLRLISSIKARSASRSMRGGMNNEKPATAEGNGEQSDGNAASTTPSPEAGAVSGNAASTTPAPEAGAVSEENEALRQLQNAEAEKLKQEEIPEAEKLKQEEIPEASTEEDAGKTEEVTGGGSAFGLQPNSRTGILYSALWLTTFCLTGVNGQSCSFTPGMLEVMPCCSKWSMLVKPLLENASDLYRLNLIGLAKTAPHAKLFLQANAIFVSTIQSFYGMSMNRSANRSIKRSFLTRRKKAHPKKTKRIRKNKTRKRR